MLVSSSLILFIILRIRGVVCNIGPLSKIGGRRLPGNVGLNPLLSRTDNTSCLRCCWGPLPDILTFKLCCLRFVDPIPIQSSEIIACWVHQPLCFGCTAGTLLKYECDGLCSSSIILLLQHKVSGSHSALPVCIKHSGYIGHPDLDGVSSDMRQKMETAFSSNKLMWRLTSWGNHLSWIAWTSRCAPMPTEMRSSLQWLLMTVGGMEYQHWCCGDISTSPGSLSAGGKQEFVCLSCACLVSRLCLVTSENHEGITLHDISASCYVTWSWR